jgi:hypothetical protein
MGEMMDFNRKSGVLNEQFYTRSGEAQRLFGTLKRYLTDTDVQLFIEPSAGAGAFSSLVPNCIALDIDPPAAATNIVKADFLVKSFETDPTKTCVFGNPPFGRQGSLAIKFLKKSFLIADYVAFILPKSFQKLSTQDKLPLTHSLLYSEDLNDDVFESPEGLHLQVRCCFQIWVRKQRQKNEKLSSQKVCFVKKSEPYSFAIRRVGGTAGRVTTGADANKTAEVTHYYVQSSAEDAPTLINILRETKWPEAEMTTGARSISSQEILLALRRGGFEL